MPPAELRPGTLYVVATPLGNLEDITLRAVRMLGQVHRILAEDTRRTKRLLNHLGHSTTLVSLHQHNELARLPAVLNWLAEGESLAAERQIDNRMLSGAGIGLAATAGLLAAPRRLSRRRLLRASLASSGLLALTPGVGFSIISELLVPDDIRAFRDASARLARLREPLHFAQR